MALSGRVARCLQQELVQQCKANAAVPRIARRAFASTTTARTVSRCVRNGKQQQARTFSRSTRLAATSQAQTAPNAKAYLESGVIAGAQNLIDVKKVLVIGSGGLSIGQPY